MRRATGGRTRSRRWRASYGLDPSGSLWAAAGRSSARPPRNARLLAASILVSGASPRLSSRRRRTLRPSSLRLWRPVTTGPDLDPGPPPRTTWLLTELDPDIAFGLCDLGPGFPELGSVQLSDITSVRGPLCLTTVEALSPAEIRALREREQVSQAVFSRYLNVRKDAVSKWERGEKRPDGPSLKLLNLVKTKGLAAIA